jgi:hypothetical protein
MTTKPSSFLPIFPFIFLISIFSVSCQRSPQFRQGENTGRNGVSSDSDGIRSATQKVEGVGQPKKSVVVLDFWNDTPVKNEELGGFVADELKRGLSLTQRVIFPMDVKTELGTTDFIDGDRVKVAQLIREGRKLGISILVIGRIKKIVFRQKGDDVGLFRQKQSLVAVELETKVFDVQGGREIMAASKTGETSNNVLVAFEANEPSGANARAELTKAAIREAVAGFLPDILRSVEKMTWQGRIAKMAGPKIYVNAGRAAGLISGDILRVLTAGDDIYDPTSGAYLGRAQGQLKGTLEVVDFIGTDGALVQVHTGGNFREGDLVQLY